MTATPQFTHDCEVCKFLGHQGGHDLYYCEREPTVVARYGSDGPEYTSGLRLADLVPILALARYLAIERGYINPPPDPPQTPEAGT